MSKIEDFHNDIGQYIPLLSIPGSVIHACTYFQRAVKHVSPELKSQENMAAAADTVQKRVLSGLKHQIEARQHENLMWTNIQLGCLSVARAIPILNIFISLFNKDRKISEEAAVSPTDDEAIQALYSQYAVEYKNDPKLTAILSLLYDTFNPPDGPQGGVYPIRARNLKHIAKDCEDILLNPRNSQMTPKQILLLGLKNSVNKWNERDQEDNQYRTSNSTSISRYLKDRLESQHLQLKKYIDFIKSLPDDSLASIADTKQKGSKIFQETQEVYRLRRKYNIGLYQTDKFEDIKKQTKFDPLLPFMDKNLQFVDTSFQSGMHNFSMYNFESRIHLHDWDKKLTDAYEDYYQDHNETKFLAKLRENIAQRIECLKAFRGRSRVTLQLNTRIEQLQKLCDLDFQPLLIPVVQ